MTSYALRGLDGTGYFELPDFKDFTAGFEFSDIGALTFNYPVSGVNASRLTHLVQVMLLIDGVEADNGRWLLKAIGGNEDNNDAAVLEWTGRSIAQAFEGAIVLGPTPASPAAVAFTAVTPGEILKTLLTQAQARGALTGITHATFSNTLDSNGVAWGSTYTQTYNAFVKYIDIFRDLVNKGLIEFKMVGLDLRVYKVDTMGTDRTALATAVTLRSGLDFSETPFTSTIDSYVSDVYVEGDNGSIQIRTGASTHPFGKQEDSISISGTADSGSLILAGDAELAARRRVRVEKTRGLKFHAATQFWPLVDYKVSDYIFQQSAGLSEKIRIRALTVQGEQSGATGGSVVLNDKFVEEEIRTVRAINAILGGSVSGGPNAPSADTDSTIPNAPTVASVTSLAYVLADGSSGTVVTATVTPPALNTDGSPYTDVGTYMVQWRYADANVPPNPGEWQQVQGSGSGVISFSPVRPGTAIQIQALAIDSSGHISAWTASTAHTTATDTTAPPVPSTPVVNSYIGTFNVIWDGLFQGAAPRPLDFDYIEVHASTSSTFTPSAATLIGTMRAAGMVTVSSLTLNVTYYFAFVAVDRTGNKSAGSTKANDTSTLISGSDIGTGTITPTNVSFTAADIGGITTSVGSSPPASPAVGSVWLDTSRLTAANISSITFATPTVTVNTSTPHNLVPGDKVTIAGNSSAGNNGTFDVLTTPSSTQFTLSNTSGVATGASGTAQAYGAGIIQKRWSGSAWAVIALDRVSFAAHTVTADQLAAGAIVAGSAVIANAAIADAQIGSLGVGKITAGTLSAAVILSGSIKTAVSGARVEMDSAGLRAYNSGGTATVNISSADGSVTLTGAVVSSGAISGTTITGGVIRTAASGARAEMSPLGVFVNAFESFTGDALETTPGYFAAVVGTPGGSSKQPGLYIYTGQFSGMGQGGISIWGQSQDGVYGPSISLTGQVHIYSGSLTIDGALVLPAASAGFELGDGSGSNVSNTPYIDFHSSGYAIDYDSRIIASAGGSVGNGILKVLSGEFWPTGPLGFAGNTLYSTNDIGFSPSGASNGVWIYKKVIMSDVYNNTSSTAGNVLIATNPQGYLYRSTASSKRFKNTIGSIWGGPVDPTPLLTLPVHQFMFNPNYLSVNDQRSNKFVPGLIAEEVMSAYPIAAEVNTETGQAEDWNARLIIPGMLALIQQLDSRLKSIGA